MTTPPSVLILYGSVRRDRAGIGLARYHAARCAARGSPVENDDPAEIDLPKLDRMYKEYPPGTAPAPMEALAAMIARAEAVIAVAGEYNHGMPPALKNLLDHFLEEWYFRPSGIACYSAGRFGGVRGAMQLRMTLAELGMPTISSLLPVPGIGDAVTVDGAARADWLPAAAERFLDDLLWWADAARSKAARDGKPY